MSTSERAAEITIYTLPWCIHCARAKALLARRRLDFEEVDVGTIPGSRRRLLELTGGYTVPQIVIDGTPIGGADQLVRLDRLDVLAAIARGEHFPIARELRRVSPRSLIRWAAARLQGRRDVPAARRTRVWVDQAGGVLGTDPAIDERTEEERDGEGMCRTAG